MVGVVMAEVTLIDALTMAMAWELEHDSRVVVLGEDVGVNGGVFRATAGLQKKFGEDRVQDTPLAEGMIAGISIGMASQGMLPIAEIQFMGFIYPTVDQIINHAARLRNRTRGRLTCPMVLRAPYGGGIHAPEHHSESTEALFAHMPGVRVVIPSSPSRAYGLLLAAIRDPDPVVFLEPKRIYRLNKQDVEDNGKALPLDVCYILREGTDVTVVTWGAMTFETLKAADQMAKSGISCEVIDLATISPIDYDTILESVEKTGRLVIAHEAARSFGVGAEVAAIVAEKGIYDLKGPIRRVTGYDVIMPLFRREMDYMPSVSKIADAIRESVND
ncbi:MAG: 2-oxoisovalerate dehydrogenase E1 component beta subunit [Woeseiaceae bacterium]|jgi:2-oxoisovalerate dehydrogenase E1 component beta subunit